MKNIPRITPAGSSRREGHRLRGQVALATQVLRLDTVNEIDTLMIQYRVSTGALSFGRGRRRRDGRLKENAEKKVPGAPWAMILSPHQPGLRNFHFLSFTLMPAGTLVLVVTFARH